MRLSPRLATISLFQVSWFLVSHCLDFSVPASTSTEIQVSYELLAGGLQVNWVKN